MGKTRTVSNKIVSVLLSLAMIFAPILESVPVYAAENEADAVIEGTMPADDAEATSEESTADGKDVTDGDVSEEDISDGNLPTVDEPEERVRAGFGWGNVGGWNETIYAEISSVAASEVTAVSYTATSGGKSGELSAEDLKYLVRNTGNGGVRIDIPGVAAGTYTLTVKVTGESDLTKDGITVNAYDRSGFAHFKYTRGVGAYNDDGTLKSGAIVLYVTDANKNTVTLEYGGKTVTGIGNILNSVGQESVAGSGLASNGGVANTNQGIIKDLALAGKPLVVRFIGTVSDSGLYEQGTFNANSACLIKGLTAYSSTDQGGTAGDNGHMARIQSGKDITLEGIGYDATIDGWGFHFICQSSNPDLGESFEVRNLTFINTPEDAVGMEGQQASKNASSKISASVERCWIHHNEYYKPSISSPAESDKSEGDGSVDFKRGQYFTCSYNYFEGCHKTNLVGSADYSLQFNLSYHHNWWYMCKARGPLARRANIHMYNNIWDMQTDYAENTRADSYIFSEYNLFYACKSPQAVEGGAIKSYHDSISSVVWNKGTPATVVANKTDKVSNNCQYSAEGINYSEFDTNPEQSYIPGGNYRLQENMTDLRKVITAETGVMEKTPKTADNVTAYSPITHSGVNVTSISGDELKSGYTTLPGNKGKVSKTTFAFNVGAAFDITVAYADAAKPGVLVNEAGENVLEGSGTATDLPAGTYMLQPVNFQPGAYKDFSSFVTWKEFTVSELSIKAHDPNAHYHKWNAGVVTTEPTCTEAGVMTYTCIAAGCSDPAETRTESIAALGHTWGAWTVKKAATADENGVKERECSVCHTKEEAAIPAGSSGTGGESGGESGGGTTGGTTVAGDYVLSFAVDGKKVTEVDEKDFFALSGSTSYVKAGNGVTINETEYTGYLKMDSKGTVTFSCNDGASLHLVYGKSSGNKTSAGQTIKVDGETLTIDDKGEVFKEELTAGSHVISRDSKEVYLYYVAVSNSAAATHQVTIDYNYGTNDANDEPDARELTVAEGTGYSALLGQAQSFLKRPGYKLNGLYEDEACTKPLDASWTVTKDVVLYAGWDEDTTPVAMTHKLIFDGNGDGALDVPSVDIPTTETAYRITQTTTRSGYAFVGWFDAPTGGNLVQTIDGSTMTGNVTVYAHWNTVEAQKLYLDFSKLADANITEGKTAAEILAAKEIAEKTTINGFTFHALSGNKEGDTNTKYYMTLKGTPVDNLCPNGPLYTELAADPYLRSVEFTASAAGTLEADVQMSGDVKAAGTYDLVLAKKASNGELVEVGRQTMVTYNGSDIKAASTRAVQKFVFNDAGNYYLYASGDKGVAYFSLKVSETQYTVRFDAGNGTAPAGLVTRTALVGDKIEIGKCTPPAGYTFMGWSLDGGKTILPGSAADKYVYTVKAADAKNGNITFTAVYQSGMHMELVSGEEFVYDGTAKKPEIHVTNNGEELVEGVDYTVKYTNNVNAAGKNDAKAPTITVTGKGNLTGKIETKFTILKKSLEDEDVIFGDVIVANASKASSALPVISYNGMVLKNKKDFTCVVGPTKGGYSMTITGIGNYSTADAEGGVHKIPVQISSQNSKFTVTVNQEKKTFTYNGKEQNASVKVYDSKNKTQELVAVNAEEASASELATAKAVYYYTNNVNAGNASVTVVGINGYTGTVTKKYAIKPYAGTGYLNGENIGEADLTYNPKGVTVGEAIEVTTDLGLDLEEGRDYKVTYKNNKKVSTEKSRASLTVTFIGNYKGTKGKDSKALTTEFNIKPASLSALGDAVQIVAADKVYTKKNAYVSKPLVTVNGVLLKAADYSVEYYRDNTFAADKKIDSKNPIEFTGDQKDQTVYVKVTGKGNYAPGTGDDYVYGTYKVVKSADAAKTIDLSKVKVTVVEVSEDSKGNVTKTPLAKWAYTGEEINPENSGIGVKIEYKDASKKYVELTDDEYAALQINYVNNVNKGKASIVINAKEANEVVNGHIFVGSKTASFSIVASDLVKAVMD